MFEQRKFYKIYASTGCSCCDYENHYRGLYLTMTEAEARKNYFKKNPLLGSQYAPSGNYIIEECDGEILPDGRVIIEDAVYKQILRVNDDGTLAETPDGTLMYDDTLYYSR